MTDRITRKVIIDTDPSADDAVALMLAMASPELEILGMTAAFGVCDSARSIKNIMKIQTLCGREEIPAVQGAEMPLVRRMEFDDAYCGGDVTSGSGEEGGARGGLALYGRDGKTLSRPGVHYLFGAYDKSGFDDSERPGGG